MTGVVVTDDHEVSVESVEKVNSNGTRVLDKDLTKSAKNRKDGNLLGKTTLGAGEKYIITVKYKVPDNFINENDKEHGDELTNTASITTNETETKSDNDTLKKYKKAEISQTKSSAVVGNDKNDHIINSGDIIEYTITVHNSGNISGATTIKDSKLKENIENDKVLMINGETTLSKDNSLTTECINVSSTLGTLTKINVSKLADEGYYLPAVEPGETVTITFKVKVGKLLPGETVENTLDEQENTYTENEVEASITVNKELVKPQNTVIVIDLSLSMAEAVNYQGSTDPMADTYEETRWYALTQALDKFLDTYMDGKNKVTIIGYNKEVKDGYILAKNEENKQTAKNSYKKVFTREQYNSIPEKYKNDVDNLTQYKDENNKVHKSGTLLSSGTNIEAGLIKASDILGTKQNGAQVILMTDGEANRKMNGNSPVDCSTEAGISAAETIASSLKKKGVTLYTVSLSLGKKNQTYINRLKNMASKGESGEALSTSANNIGDLTKYFEEISEMISEYHNTLTTQNGILVLKNTAFKIDSRYVQNVVITIPNEETDNEFSMTWKEFADACDYDPVAKTINITNFAKSKGIAGITGKITIQINVDPTINAD